MNAETDPTTLPITPQDEPPWRKKWEQLTRPKHRTLEDLLVFKFPDLVQRLRQKLNLSEEDALVLFNDTKRFLHLCATRPGRWSPTTQIDEGWHNFILFTKDYARFCKQYLGRFIHHSPKGATAQQLKAMTVHETSEMARSLFGNNLSANWSPGPISVAECSKSGCNCSPDTGGGGSEFSPD